MCYSDMKPMRALYIDKTRICFSVLHAVRLHFYEFNVGMQPEDIKKPRIAFIARYYRSRVFNDYRSTACTRQQTHLTTEKKKEDIKRRKKNIANCYSHEQKYPRVSRIYSLKLKLLESGQSIVVALISQVGFDKLKETADDRANIGGTIIGAPIVGPQLAQYILTDHQDADCRPMIRLILSCQL